MFIGSDEETPAACTPGNRRTHQNTARTQFSDVSLTKVANKLRGLQRELLEFDSSVPEIVNFCVDGKRFSVQRDVLLKDPQSVLFLMATMHFRQNSGKDHENDMIEIPCRDAVLFGMLLNLLRGYKNPIPEAYHEACCAEARFYGLQQSWESHYPVAAAGPFRPLSCSDRLFSDVVCAAASPFYSSGLHVITFGVVRCDTAAVGVVAEGACLCSMESIGRCEGLALCWNDGRVAHNFGALVAEKTGYAFAPNAVIKVELDCEENIVKWTLSGDQCVAVVRLPPHTSYAFAAVAVKSTEVQILRGE
ncbi:uncharacterized protein TM35_000441230 [Trypanosoma theileri]|uniref:BTB domain-containing protein n=1 Tax=Trypanosoma theileri TaxID=67003 RepID=A0A1X0NIJ4_9TRYP|nr:uncharacterized protein TM35_000441230 [Trypanosoma theileri]ORC84467.1 hypothetical protein TM35_000441230 [Trypanosoma theileri]